MLHAVTFTPLTILLAALVLIVTALLLFQKSDNEDDKTKSSEDSTKPQTVALPEAPGPKTYPIIGNLHVMAGYEVPYQAFSALGKKYGNIIKLQLGNVKALVVNGQENIREILITKGQHYDSRPNFERYHKLFGGDKENCKYL